MKLLFLLAVLLGSGCGVYALLSSYNGKISSLKMDLMLTKKQLAAIQSQYKKMKTSKNNISIEFLDTDEGLGIINPNTPLYISPDKNSSILYKSKKELNVIILDKVSVDNVIWYYSALPIETNVNCKGWILYSDFSKISPKLQVAASCLKEEN